MRPTHGMNQAARSGCVVAPLLLDFCDISSHGLLRDGSGYGLDHIGVVRACRAAAATGVRLEIARSE